MMNQDSNTNSRSSTLKTLHAIRRAGLEAKLPPRELDTLRAMLVSFEWGKYRIYGKVSISQLAREMRRDRGSIGESVRSLISLGILVECEPVRRGFASTLELHLDHIENQVNPMPESTGEPSTPFSPSPHPHGGQISTAPPPTSPPPVARAANIPITPKNQSSSSEVETKFLAKSVDQYIAGNRDSVRNPSAYRKAIMNNPNPQITSMAKELMEKEVRKREQLNQNEVDKKIIDTLCQLDTQRLGIELLDCLKSDREKGEKLIQSICDMFCITQEHLPQQIGTCITFNDRTKVERHRVASVARLAIAHYQLIERYQNIRSNESNTSQQPPRLIRCESQSGVSL